MLWVLVCLFLKTRFPSLLFQFKKKKSSTFFWQAVNINSMQIHFTFTNIPDSCKVTTNTTAMMVLPLQYINLPPNNSNHMISPQNDIIQAPSSQNLTKRKTISQQQVGQQHTSQSQERSGQSHGSRTWRTGFWWARWKWSGDPKDVGGWRSVAPAKPCTGHVEQLAQLQQAGMSSVCSTQPWLNHVMTVGFRCKGCKWHGQPAVKPSHVLSLKWKATRRCKNQRWLKSPAAIAEHQGTPSPPPPFPTACLSWFALC